MLSPLGIRGGEGHLSISEERDWHEYSTLVFLVELTFSWAIGVEAGETEE